MSVMTTLSHVSVFDQMMCLKFLAVEDFVVMNDVDVAADKQQSDRLQGGLIKRYAAAATTH